MMFGTFVAIIGCVELIVVVWYGIMELIEIAKGRR